MPRHEQTTSYMADGYARTSTRIGTCMVVPGPGLLNAMAGLATAYASNARVLAIVELAPAVVSFAFGCPPLGSLSRMFAILWTQHRCSLVVSQI